MITFPPDIHQIVLPLRLTVVFVIFFNLACGQTNPKAIKLFQNGQDLMAKKKTDQALKSFESAIALDPAYREAYLELYQIYTQLGNTPKAIQTLQQASRSVLSGKPSILYALGQLEINNGLYQDASTHLSEYLALNSRDTLTRARAGLLLAKTQFALSHIGDSVSILYVPLNSYINTPDPEYLPSLDASGSILVFTRRIDHQEDLYISRRIGKEWSLPIAWPKNSAKNEGAHVISADSKTIVVTGCGWEDSYGGCDLYISEFKTGRWTNPKNMGAIINSRAWESQPSLSADGRTLYFVSDRSGGLGGYDIWKSTRVKSGWTKPINAGSSINTSWDEFSPFLHADGVSFYFRSDGRPGFGSQDLYLSRKLTDGKWADAINLGFPLNDYRDQGAMSISIDGATAYYTRQDINPLNQLVASDIVTFNLPEPIRANPCIYIQGMVVDNESGQILPNMPITIAGGINLSRKDTLFSDSEGQYLLVVPAGASYQVHVQVAGFNLYSDRIVADQDGFQADTLVHLIRLERLNALDTLLSKPIILQNVLFELNSYQLLSESFYELDALVNLLKENPDLRVAIHGHTDNTGMKEANLTLSRQRALSIYNYLISKDINPARLSYLGFGDSRPIADNQLEKGRQMNRRVEFVLSKKRD